METDHQGRQRSARPGQRPAPTPPTRPPSPPGRGAGMIAPLLVRSVSVQQWVRPYKEGLTPTVTPPNAARLPQGPRGSGGRGQPDTVLRASRSVGKGRGLTVIVRHLHVLSVPGVTPKRRPFSEALFEDVSKFGA